MRADRSIASDGRGADSRAHAANISVTPMPNTRRPMDASTGPRVGSSLRRGKMYGKHFPTRFGFGKRAWRSSMRNRLQNCLTALDDDLELDIARLVARHQFGNLRAQSRGEGFVSQSADGLARALPRNQVSVIQLANHVVQDLRIVRGSMTRLGGLARLAQVRLEQIALVRAVLDLAQSAIPHALERDELREHGL